MVSISFKEHQVYGNLSVEKQLDILVVDDHQLILTGTLDVLSREYPKATIIKAQTGKETLSQLNLHQFHLIVMDLSIPDQQGETAEIDTGMKLLQILLQEYPHQNVMVQTSYVKALIRIKHEIDNHQGGFAIADKGLPEDEMLMRLNLALNGGTHTKYIKKSRNVECRYKTLHTWLE
ncbi:response regulator [Nostoc sp.]|uniref:response regulator n=1 Tax=Nostoc sp. TaxID=1180 RepID=UPI002FF7856E